MPDLVGRNNCQCFALINNSKYDSIANLNTGKYAPANRVDPEDKDENKNDRLLVLDKSNIVVDHNWWLALQNGGGVGDASVLELQYLEQLS